MPPNPQLNRLFTLTFALIDALNRGETHELSTLLSSREEEISRIEKLSLSLTTEEIEEITTLDKRMMHFMLVGRDQALRESRMNAHESRAAKAFARPERRSFDSAS